MKAREKHVARGKMLPREYVGAPGCWTAVCVSVSVSVRRLTLEGFGLAGSLR